MKHIQQEYNIAYLFISHDLGVVKHMSEDIAIMHRGRFVEIGKRDQIYKNPMHIYTKRLLSAIPVVDVEHREQHKEERQRVEKEFLQDQDKWYEKDGRVLPLQKVGDRHFVALPKEMIKQELKEGE
jgi:peptide/nickel transport system ATP-binding protein